MSLRILITKTSFTFVVTILEKELCQDYTLILINPFDELLSLIMLFCEGCNIKGGAKSGIHFTYSSDGRPSGECFVELVSVEDMNK